MPEIFTNFASSRFIDQQAVIDALRKCAQRLVHQSEAVLAIFLDLPVPVDLWVLSSAALAEGKRQQWSVAGRAVKEGIRLA